MLQARNGLLGKLHFVYVVVASVIKDLDNWLWVWEDRRISDRGQGDECSNMKGKTKMTLPTEGEN